MATATMKRIMYRIPVNFISLHYAYIISCSVLAFIILYPNGKLRAIDAVFFGASANTESGLNTIDVKQLKIYQQFVLYLFPILTNLGFIHPVVIFIRLRAFEARFKQVGWPRRRRGSDAENAHHRSAPVLGLDDGTASYPPQLSFPEELGGDGAREWNPVQDKDKDKAHAASSATKQGESKSQPRTRVELIGDSSATTSSQEVNLELSPLPIKSASPVPTSRAITFQETPVRGGARPQAALDDLPPLSSHTTTKKSSLPRRSSGFDREDRSQAALDNLPQLSASVSVGRNSMFYNLTQHDREVLGGIEYRSLRILLGIVIVYYVGLHIFGILCLLPWIMTAPAKYTEYLASQGQGRVWWAFYSTQTMVNNLGFTLTPDSMITFRDATWPMLVMTFLAFAGETCYPVFLRLIIWASWKLAPTKSSFREPLRFLLDHPRRCYTLLFPSSVTQALFGVIFALNFIDVLFIIVLDLHSEEVASLPFGPRLLAAIFQAASSRHTGTSTFNLAKVNPGVQFSLLVMMYVAVFPIAMSVRSSNTYETRAIGILPKLSETDETQSTSAYLVSHLRNQMSHDLWYVAIGCFIICIIEADALADPKNSAFNVFAILFEVVSAYGNVGLSLGTNATLTSLSGDFHTGSKLVICAMMIRGRHRGLPEAVDRAVMLPGEDVFEEPEETEVLQLPKVDRLRRIRTM